MTNKNLLLGPMEYFDANFFYTLRKWKTRTCNVCFRQRMETHLKRCHNVRKVIVKKNIQMYSRGVPDLAYFKCVHYESMMIRSISVLESRSVLIFRWQHIVSVREHNWKTKMHKSAHEEHKQAINVLPKCLACALHGVDYLQCWNKLIAGVE